MKHLLDVNVLLAGVWTGHAHNATAFAWLEGKALVPCPIAGLGFLRISTDQKAFNYSMEAARKGLRQFCSDRKVEWISYDLLPLDSKAAKSEAVTDSYLADLAAKHGLRLATFDTGIKHPAVDLVS